MSGFETMRERLTVCRNESNELDGRAGHGPQGLSPHLRDLHLQRDQDAESLGFTIRILSMRKPRESFSHAAVKDIRARVDYLPEEISGHLAGSWPTPPGPAAQNPGGFARALAHSGEAAVAKTRKATSLKHFSRARASPAAGFRARESATCTPTSPTPRLGAYFASLMSGLPFSFTAHAKDIWTQDPESLAEKLAAARFVVTCTEANHRYLFEPRSRRHAGDHGLPRHRLAPVLAQGGGARARAALPHPVGRPAHDQEGDRHRAARPGPAHDARRGLRLRAGGRTARSEAVSGTH
jgi:hypothetical protein